MTAGIADQFAAFRAAKQAEAAEARQTAALFLASGIDFAKALAADGEEKARLVSRLERLLERERLRGSRRHWSYDLNRHIALKQALDRLRGRVERDAPNKAETLVSPPKRVPGKNAKRRREAPPARDAAKKA
jgi:hypothetical protein